MKTATPEILHNFGAAKQATPILERLELKYTIPGVLVDRIADFISPYCVFDEYSASSSDDLYEVNSLYFDSPQYYFLRQRLMKAESRFNMRIRSYGNSPKPPYFLEIKHRKGDVVRKFRAKVFTEALESFLCAESGCEGGANEELFRRTMIKYNARPVVLIQYRRKAFESTCDQYARVTFDTTLRYLERTECDPRPCENSLISCDAQTFFDPGCDVVLELKCYAKYVPLWMVDLIRKFQLRRRGFSKYSIAVRPAFERYNLGGIFNREPAIAGMRWAE